MSTVARVLMGNRKKWDAEIVALTIASRVDFVIGHCPLIIVVQLKSVKPLTLADTERTRSAETTFPAASCVFCRSHVSVMYDEAAGGFHAVSVMFNVTAAFPVFLT